MRINDNNTSLADTLRISGAQANQQIDGKSLSDAVRESSSGGDHVSLSGLAAGLAALDPASPERQAHLEHLQGLVVSGRYSPDATRVADGMISDALRSTSIDLGSGE